MTTGSTPDAPDDQRTIHRMELDGADAAAQSLLDLKATIEADPTNLSVEERLTRLESVAATLIEASAGMLAALLNTVTATDEQFQSIAHVINGQGRVLGTMLDAMEGNARTPTAAPKRIITLDQLR